MAIAKNGLQGNFVGKIGNTCYYMLNGDNVSRKRSKASTTRTKDQENAQQSTKMCNEFLKRLKGFTEVGFPKKAEKRQWNYFNFASHYNRNRIVTGFHPELRIAYDQVILSKGPLKPAQGCVVTQLNGGLRYQWLTDPQMPWPEASDQVMMLAYFPEEKQTAYTVFGPARSSGSAFLDVPPSLQGKYMETYVSFVAADRSQVSDSLYTGAFNTGQAEQLTLPF